MNPHTIPTPPPPTPDWREAAGCVDEGHLFYGAGREEQPERVARETAAKDVCATCPVMASCLTTALDTRERYGIWGGATTDERDRMLNTRARRERRARVASGEPRQGRPVGLPPINHGTYGGAVIHRRRGIPACEPCRKAERVYRNERRARAQRDAS